MKSINKFLWGCNVTLLFLYVFFAVLSIGAYYLWGKVSLTALEQFSCPACLDKMGMMYGFRLLSGSFLAAVLVVIIVFWLFKKFYKENDCYFSVGWFFIVLGGLEYAIWVIASHNLSLKLMHLFILWCVIVLSYLINLWRRYEAKYIFYLMVLCYPLFLMICIFYQPLLFSSYKGVEQTSNSYDFEVQSQRNLIVVYVESFNRDFASVVYEGKKYKVNDEDAVVFSYFKEGVEQDFTKNALVASFSGTIPSYYTENQLTIGEIVKNKGYQNVFMQGGEIDFAGTFDFLSKAGFDKNNIIGLSESKFMRCRKNLKNCPIDEIIKEKNKMWWGVEDKKTFEAFKKKIGEFDKDRPFFAVMFTIDLHEGTNPWYDDFENIKAINIANLNDFIAWVKEQDFYENTSLIILADHARPATEDKENAPLYNAFFNLPKVLTKNLNKNRTFVQTDMYLTMLEIMGFKLSGGRLGYSTSLFSSKQTIAEKYTNAQMVEGEAVGLLSLLGKSKRVAVIVADVFHIFIQNL